MQNSVKLRQSQTFGTGYGDSSLGFYRKQGVTFYKEYGLAVLQNFLRKFCGYTHKQCGIKALQSPLKTVWFKMVAQTLRNNKIIKAP